MGRSSLAMTWVLLLRSLLLNPIRTFSTRLQPTLTRKFLVPQPFVDTLLTIHSGAVVALFTAGAFFGAMFAGPTTEYTGRRWTISIGSIIFIVGGALQTAAPKISYLMAGRFLAGLGVGFLTMIIPLYQAEIAHPSIRGKLQHSFHLTPLINS